MALPALVLELEWSIPAPALGSNRPEQARCRPYEARCTLEQVRCTLELARCTLVLALACYTLALLRQWCSRSPWTCPPNGRRAPTGRACLESTSVSVVSNYDRKEIRTVWVLAIRWRRSNCDTRDREGEERNGSLHICLLILFDFESESVD